MSNEPDVIVDNILEGSDELDDYLEKEIKDVLKNIVLTMLKIHGDVVDPIRLFYLINVVVNKYVVNLLSFHHKISIDTLKKHNVIVDLTEIGEMKKRMK